MMETYFLFRSIKPAMNEQRPLDNETTSAKPWLQVLFAGSMHG